jgi:hypothetical protein
MAKSERSGKSPRGGFLASRKTAIKAVSSFRAASKGGNKAAATKHGWSSKKPAKKAARGYQVVGITTDGVRILRAKVKPKHFTSKQIRRAITEIEKPVPIRA